MIDINFFQKIHETKKRILAGEKFTKKELLELFERSRSKKPVIYNIETTNACNMVCKMCPRTTMMTREIKTLPQNVFDSLVEQIEPFSDHDWERWEKFVEKEYNIKPDDMSENHFYLNIIPRVIQLHGYGDPLLDRQLPQRVKSLTAKRIQTYFSCNPANINIEKSVDMMESGLSYIKYSIESVDDDVHKKIRGECSNFGKAFKDICKLLEIKKERSFDTIFVITMIDLGKYDQVEEFEKLKRAFEGKDVYIYLKSQDQQWYENKNIGTKSVHWSEICQHPWYSMTIKSDGEAAMCMEDFNNEIILGNILEESLYDIWNGKKYQEFRKAHFGGACGLKCDKECDMKLVGDFLSK